MLKCGITGSTGNLGNTFINTNKNFNYIKFKGDIRQKKQVYNWVKNNNFDLIIHFAALVPTGIVNKNYKKALDINYKGTKHLVDALIKFKKKIKWFFYSSTSHVYPLQKKRIKETNIIKSSSKYGKTKFLAENYLKKKFTEKRINFCIGRIFSIFDNKSVGFLLPSLKNKINKKSKKIILENLNHYRDFLSTKQISKVIFFLWSKKFVGTINIGSGRKTNLKSVAKIIGSKEKKELFFRNNKPSYHIADISKLRQLGFNQNKLNFSKFL